ncbi:MAG TPA: hypothetical protein VHD56_16335 [Tepidisphaeraceae bacterium]|nr:hypothetical protein [Tepidisphaeraceae bacterium]
MQASEALFRPVELKRVGTAATMIAVCGTVIIISMTMMMGHYNSLAHCGPKAVLDGAVIALLIGKTGRWRCLALLGVVYGLVLLLQVGIFYLLPVMIVAGLVAAGIGRTVGLLHRGMGLMLASAAYEILAGCGTPIKIYFATNGGSEPFVWALWFMEWPLRMAGAIIGVWIALRWMSRRVPDSSIATQPAFHSTGVKSKTLVAKGLLPAAVRIVACVVACTVPMLLESYTALGLITAGYLAFAIWTGLRRQIFHAIIGALWGWLIFGLLSFAWHHDMHRVLDLSRTLVLRFLPIALASIVVVSTVRPIDVIRLLRRLRLSPAVLIPLSTVMRSIPASRRSMRASIEQLRAAGLWKGPLSLFKNPVVVIRTLLSAPVKQWANELAEEAG